MVVFSSTFQGVWTITFKLDHIITLQFFSIMIDHSSIRSMLALPVLLLNCRKLVRSVWGNSCCETGSAITGQVGSKVSIHILHAAPGTITKENKQMAFSLKDFSKTQMKDLFFHFFPIVISFLFRNNLYLLLPQNSACQGHIFHIEICLYLNDKKISYNYMLYS